VRSQIPQQPEPEPDAASASASAADAAAAAPEPPTDDALPARRCRGKRRRRLGLLILAAVLICVLAVPPATDALISASTARAVANRVDELTPKPIALLLGTARKNLAGGPNQFYAARIEAAAALFHSGKVQGILVSGDNATRWYNEPIAMQKDLIAAGVPAEFITLDYAGFRTLDSVVRAKEVFGQGQIIVVSQRFHAERAIFLARHFGIDASGLAAADPDNIGMLKVRTREVFARVAAILDLVTGREPRFLGKPETVRLRDPSADDAV
jgi:SanA protein